MGAAAGILQGDMVGVEFHSPAGYICYPAYFDVESDTSSSEDVEHDYHDAFEGLY